MPTCTRVQLPPDSTSPCSGVLSAFRTILYLVAGSPYPWQALTTRIAALRLPELTYSQQQQLLPSLAALGDISVSNTQTSCSSSALTDEQRTVLPEPQVIVSEHTQGMDVVLTMPACRAVIQERAQQTCGPTRPG